MRTARTRDLLYVHEAAAILGLTKKTTNNLVSQGRIPRANPGGRGTLALVRRADVDTYDQGRRPAAAAAVVMRDNPEDPRHGTKNGYGNLGCRCPRCTEATRIAQAEQVARPRQLAPGDPRHGTRYARTYWHCHCEICEPPLDPNLLTTPAAMELTGHTAKAIRAHVTPVAHTGRGGVDLYDPLDIAAHFAPIPNHLISLLDLARQRGVTRQRVYQLMAADRLVPFRQIRGQVYFLCAEVDDIPPARSVTRLARLDKDARDRQHERRKQTAKLQAKWAVSEAKRLAASAARAEARRLAVEARRSASIKAKAKARVEALAKAKQSAAIKALVSSAGAVRARVEAEVEAAEQLAVLAYQIHTHSGMSPTDAMDLARRAMLARRA